MICYGLHIEIEAEISGQVIPVPIKLNDQRLSPSLGKHMRIVYWPWCSLSHLLFMLNRVFLWLNLFHREQRTKEDPNTPDKFQMCSTRSWVGQIKNWRRKLHVWDPPSEGQEDLFSSSSQRYLESTLYFCWFCGGKIKCAKRLPVRNVYG